MKELVAVVIDAKGVERQRIYAVPAGANGVRVNVTEPSIPGSVIEPVAEKTTVLRVETEAYLEFKKAEANKIAADQAPLL